MTTDLSSLTTAADKWDAAAKDFEGIQKTYDSQVKSVGFDGSWTGQANLYAQPNMQQTSGQYAAAAKEARAIASLLRDAQAQFTDLRSKLKSVVAEAEKNGLKVSNDGTVSSAVPTDRAAMHDPDYQAVLAKEASLRSTWAQNIADAVQAFDDADQGVKMALTSAVKDTDLFDGNPNSFNAQAEGDLEKAEAKETIRVAEKIRSGKGLDANELAEAPWLFRTVAQDKKASQFVLDTIGADGTIELSNRLNGLAGSGDKAHKQAYEAIQSALAGTVSTATQDPKSPFYDKWREGLRKAGTKNFGSKTDPVYGYPSFVSLMEHHDKYGKRFLNDLGDDIIAAEKKHQDIWTKWRDHPGISNDPLDHLLGVMSKNPEAATSFLDPGANGKNDHLQYLLKDRHWPRITVNGPGMLASRSDPASEAGLGLAIEAAATGREPDSAMGKPGPHQEGQARVLQQTISILDADGKGDSIAANLRKPIGRALNDYVADTHSIFNGQDSPIAGSKDIRGSGNNAHIANAQASLIRVLRGVADDDETFAMLYRSENAYMAGVLSSGENRSDTGNSIGNWNNRADEIGGVRGIYNSVGADVILDNRDNRVAWANDTARYGYHGLGTLANKLPILPDEAQRMVDSLTYEWSKDVIAEANNRARMEGSQHYAVGLDGTYEIVDRWADGRQIDRNTVAVESMRRQAKNSYSAGRDAALDALRPPA
ncbi:hypothetical protein [Streptomyces sp. UNOC14_S4]|uniref:hypothetical protein n=1 Tax=Streptomyces sp. UNOC14_S4 TaxID=2872340 RepID=UPI001E462900|nr:hypothetical protein [Streptomyces sp. UNOC14_S4]MCC3766636.1 hypothetical protein [Streptomyces sp. UNOC14_S4]